MDIQERLKRIDKMTKKRAKDTAELKSLLLEGKPTAADRKAADHIISQMIVRTETAWASLRALGRILNSKG